MNYFQNHIRNPLKYWASQFDAIFWPDKTFITHFSKNNKILQPTLASKMPILNDINIYPSLKLKLLRVVLNQKLKYYKHIGISLNKILDLRKPKTYTTKQ